MSRRTLAGVGSAVVVSTALALWVVLASRHPIGSKAAIATVGLLIGLSFIGSGMIARTRRPENRTGLLLMAVGFAWYLSALSQANNRYLFTLGQLVGAISFGTLIHLVTAFPTGRLESRFARVIGVSGYVIVLGVNTSSLLFSDLRRSCGKDCPQNVLLVHRDEGLAKALQAAFAVSAAALAVGVVVFLVRRWRRATPALRRALAPVFVAGATTLGAAALELFASTTKTARAPAYWLLLSVFATVPLAFLAGPLRSRLAGAA